MFILDPFRPLRGSDDTPPLRRWRTIIIAIILVLLTVLFSVLAEQMFEEEPSIKISYNKSSDAILMPNLLFTFNKKFSLRCDGFPDCGKYFVNTSIEDNAIYKSVSEPEMKFIWYLPNGTIRFKEKSKKFTFFIDINDPTYNNLNEPDDFIINVFDSEIMPYITKLNGANFFAALHIKPWTLMTGVEKEQKTHNITNVLGTISAIYGSMFAIYLFLFKKDLSSGEPYGLIYDFYNKDKKKVKKQNDESKNRQT
ncbi:hypothetical protein C2G38_2138696 [Gigaspora rosea]|uniref:Uncharacterized protein n=1 Tax=Gigaspora rosea TaxID=44941 RepID=A0A397VUJ1_9GLOM|nr:hypothetical protein C2G38_2138696 [Gigaspora rosea]